MPFPTPTLMPGIGQGNLEYTVKEGDTIAVIADAYGLTPEKIFRANNLQDGATLVPGAVLMIPVEESVAAPYEYIVVEGDTCESIGEAFGISIQSIVSENHLSEDCLIMVGQVLKIPGAPSTSSIVGQKIEGVRGTLMVTIHKLVDGSQRVEYGLYPKPNDAPFYYATLEGNDVQKLEAYHNHPVDIWGTITGVDQNGMPQVQVERYEIPYPDLQFQILKGTQKVAELEGERVGLFTTSDGNTFVQLTSTGFPDITIPATEGSDVLLQILAIPGESFGGYPALRVFDAVAALNPRMDSLSNSQAQQTNSTLWTRVCSPVWRIMCLQSSPSKVWSWSTMCQIQETDGRVPVQSPICSLPGASMDITAMGARWNSSSRR